MVKEPKFKKDEIVFYENFWTKFAGRVSKVIKPKGIPDNSPSLYDEEYHYVLCGVDTRKPLAGKPTPECDLVSHESYTERWAHQPKKAQWATVPKVTINVTLDADSIKPIYSGLYFDAYIIDETPELVPTDHLKEHLVLTRSQTIEMNAELKEITKLFN